MKSCSAQKTIKNKVDDLNKDKQRNFSFIDIAVNQHIAISLQHENFKSIPHPPPPPLTPCSYQTSIMSTVNKLPDLLKITFNQDYHNLPTCDIFYLLLLLK